jgi:catechol 2,3-dioxygenase-like lactoylglutathione lyase family enzyme
LDLIGRVSRGSATIAVAGFDRAIRFYTETLGLKLLARFGGDWACIDAGNGLLIGIHAKYDGTKDAPTVGMCVTEPIESVVESLRGRGVVFDGPVVELPMVKLAFFAGGNRRRHRRGQRLDLGLDELLMAVAPVSFAEVTGDRSRQ